MRCREQLVHIFLRQGEVEVGIGELGEPCTPVCAAMARAVPGMSCISPGAPDGVVRDRHE